jgi:hypothetical protein
MALGTQVACATTFDLTPRDLGSGFSFAGSITTDSTVGALTAANITGWNIQVNAVNDFYFTAANTANASSGLSVSGNQLLVPTSPDGFTDGGSLSFRGGNRLQVQVADFTGANIAGGGAYYVYGSAFDIQTLGQPDATNYVAAASASGNVFDLVPITFPGGAVMSGTVTTNGQSGTASLVDWNIRVRDTMSWTFNSTNSSVLADVGLVSDGIHLTVAPIDAISNPGSFVIGAYIGFDLNGVVLADFSTDPSGQAGYVSPSVLQLITGLPLDADGNVVVAQAVPEPSGVALMGIGLAVVAMLGRRRLQRT